jgi:hypothetical protein
MPAMQDLKLKDVTGTWFLNMNDSIRLIIGSKEVQYIDMTNDNNSFHELISMKYLINPESPHNTIQLSKSVIIYMLHDDGNIEFKIKGERLEFERH